MSMSCDQVIFRLQFVRVVFNPFVYDDSEYAFHNSLIDHERAKSRSLYTRISRFFLKGPPVVDQGGGGVFSPDL